MDTLVLGSREVNMRAYVAAFNLRGPMQEKRVGSLSGGERAQSTTCEVESLRTRHLPGRYHYLAGLLAYAGERGRVHLAKTLREGCNLLLLGMCVLLACDSTDPLSAFSLASAQLT